MLYNSGTLRLSHISSAACVDVTAQGCGRGFDSGPPLLQSPLSVQYRPRRLECHREHPHRLQHQEPSTAAIMALTADANFQKLRQWHEANGASLNMRAMFESDRERFGTFR